MSAMEIDKDDLAAQEAAARDYQPELTGPLVGDRTPIEAITAEYAKAHEVFIAKTQALPATYSHYRPIQGDGSCGWRAIAFGYFESLIASGNVGMVNNEIERIGGLKEFIEHTGGYPPMVFEDMHEETLTLLRKVHDSIHEPDRALNTVLETFRDDMSGSAILYHLRLLTASLYKSREAHFNDFVPSEAGAASYCETTLTLPGAEIDEIGIRLLAELLLENIGAVLQISYLDLSPGTEANTYTIPDLATTPNPDAWTSRICLLFRPNHYDIVYPRPRHEHNVQVHQVFVPDVQLPFVAGGLDMYGYGMGFDPWPVMPGFAKSTDDVFPYATAPIAFCKEMEMEMATYASSYGSESSADSWEVPSSVDLCEPTGVKFEDFYGVVSTSCAASPASSYDTRLARQYSEQPMPYAASMFDASIFDMDTSYKQPSAFKGPMVPQEALCGAVWDCVEGAPSGMTRDMPVDVAPPSAGEQYNPSWTPAPQSPKSPARAKQTNAMAPPPARSPFQGPGCPATGSEKHPFRFVKFCHKSSSQLYDHSCGAGLRDTRGGSEPRHPVRRSSTSHHFTSPDFQPEEYSPAAAYNDDAAVSGTWSGQKKRRSSESRWASATSGRKGRRASGSEVKVKMEH